MRSHACADTSTIAPQIKWQSSRSGYKHLCGMFHFCLQPITNVSIDFGPASRQPHTDCQKQIFNVRQRRIAKELYDIFQLHQKKKCRRRNRAMTKSATAFSRETKKTRRFVSNQNWCETSFLTFYVFDDCFGFAVANEIAKPKQKYCDDLEPIVDDSMPITLSLHPTPSSSLHSSRVNFDSSPRSRSASNTYRT